MRLPNFNFDPDELDLSDIPMAMAIFTAWQLRMMERVRNNGHQVASKLEPVTQKKDRMLTTTEAAEKLRRSRTWLYRRAKKLPFAREMGPRSWVFSEDGIDKWLEKQKP